MYNGPRYNSGLKYQAVCGASYICNFFGPYPFLDWTWKGMDIPPKVWIHISTKEKVTKVSMMDFCSLSPQLLCVLQVEKVEKQTIWGLKKDKLAKVALWSACKFQGNQWLIKQFLNPKFRTQLIISKHPSWTLCTLPWSSSFHLSLAWATLVFLVLSCFISDYLRLSLAISGYLWLPLTISDNLWQFLVISGSFWQSKVN